MKERFLKPKLDLPKLTSKIPSIHRHKLSLDLSLITAPNKNISQVVFPSARQNSISVSRNQINYFPPPQKPSAKVVKKFCQSSMERLKSPFPISGLEALRVFNDALTEYELRELPNYNEVYFIGDQNFKIHGSLREVNWGYDDDDANYRVVQGDHLAYRYEVLGIIGKGSFGIVCRCFDHKHKEAVAIKILKNKHKFHNQGNIEIKLLRHINQKSQDSHLGSFPIIPILSSFIFRYHICIVFPLLHMSLYEFSKRNNFRPFTSQVIKKISIQLLKGLEIIADCGIIHCDLKPENILFVSSKSIQIKIIDLGSGCYEPDQMYTYIQSRFYRSPEVMLGLKYSKAIDMWSLGCILVELYRGFPLFPGKNEEDLMSRIVEVLGLPDKDFIETAPRKEVFFDIFSIPLPVLDSKGQVRYPGGCPLSKIIPDEANFLDFIKKIICWDPQDRLTPTQALAHEWLNN